MTHEQQDNKSLCSDNTLATNLKLREQTAFGVIVTFL